MSFRYDLEHVLACTHELAELARLWASKPTHIIEAGASMLERLAIQAREDARGLNECWNVVVEELDKKDDSPSVDGVTMKGLCERGTRLVGKCLVLLEKAIKSATERQEQHLSSDSKRLLKSAVELEAIGYEVARRENIVFSIVDDDDSSYDYSYDEEENSDDHEFVGGDDDNDEDSHDQTRPDVLPDDETLLHRLEDDSERLRVAKFEQEGALDFVAAVRAARSGFAAALRVGIAIDNANVESCESTAQYIRAAAIRYDAASLALDENVPDTLALGESARHDVLSGLARALTAKTPYALRRYAHDTLVNVEMNDEDAEMILGEIERVVKKVDSRKRRRYAKVTGSQPITVE